MPNNDVSESKISNLCRLERVKNCKHCINVDVKHFPSFRFFLIRTPATNDVNWFVKVLMNGKFLPKYLIWNNSSLEWPYIWNVRIWGGPVIWKFGPKMHVHVHLLVHVGRKTVYRSRSPYFYAYILNGWPHSTQLYFIAWPYCTYSLNFSSPDVSLNHLASSIDSHY